MYWLATRHSYWGVPARELAVRSSHQRNPRRAEVQKAATAAPSFTPLMIWMSTSKLYRFRYNLQVLIASHRSVPFVALQEEYGPIAQQRCWVHTTANILDKMPKSVQGKTKQLIHEMYLAPTRKAALAAYDQFISSYQIKFPKACDTRENFHQGRNLWK